MNKRQKKKTREKLWCEYCDEYTTEYIFFTCNCGETIVLCDDCRIRVMCKRCRDENLKIYGGGYL